MFISIMLTSYVGQNTMKDIKLSGLLEMHKQLYLKIDL